MLSICSFTRFSVVNHQSIQSFNKNRKLNDITQVEKVIFDEKRLAHHWNYFQSLTLPSLSALADAYDQFYAFVLISPNLPSEWKTKLEQLSNQLRWLHLLNVSFDETLSSISRNAIAEFASTERYFSFRIDDDDAISSKILERILHLAEYQPDDTMISFDRGYYVRPFNKNRIIIKEKTMPNIALGLGIFSNRQHVRSALCFGNHTKPQYPVTHLDDEPYWIRTVHGQNDSDARVGPFWSIGSPISKAANQINDHFPNLNLDKMFRQLKASMPTARYG